MYFSNEATSWLDTIDDGHAMIGRLKILEHLLIDCICDIPPIDRSLKNNKAGEYNVNDMLFFIDESLTYLIEEYESQVAKHKAMFEKDSKSRQNDSPDITTDSYTPNFAGTA